MFRQLIVGCYILALSAACDDSTEPEQPPPLPGPNVDQVGLPENYATELEEFYVFDRPALTVGGAPQVRVVYANDAAVAGPPPFDHGSILVMETYSVQRDDQGAPILDAAGRYQRVALSGIFVSRKEKWFGRRYGENQTGDWEYASYQPNGTPTNQVGDAAVSCAICHLEAGASRDWVYRANIHFSDASGAPPQPRPGQPANQPFIDSYAFVPGTITVPVQTTITWKNDDQVWHTVTADGGTFSSGTMVQGESFSRNFSTPGTFEYHCGLHPGMKGSVVVQP